MAWNNSVVTNSGVALLQQVLAGGTLTIDGAAGGTGTVLPGVLMAQTSLKNQKQAFSVVGATNVTNGKKVNILVSNADLSTGYTMQQVGIWAHVGEGSSVLFAILQDDTGIAIPSESDIPDFALNFYAVVDFSNESDFALAVDPSALVSFGMLTEAVSDAINEAKGYTDSVVATIDISSKLDKTGNGSDVTAAFTQAETRTNIATGEKLSVLFGKIKKWFADLGSAAFKDVGVVGGVAGHDALTSHLAENASTSAKGHVQLSTSTTSTSTSTAATSSAVKAAMDKANSAFQSASDGKTLIGGAITGVDPDVVIPTDPTFQQLATAIGQIETGKKLASGNIYHGGSGGLTLTGLTFRPSTVILFPTVTDTVDRVWHAILRDTKDIHLSNDVSNFTNYSIASYYDGTTYVSTVSQNFITNDGFNILSGYFKLNTKYLNRNFFYLAIE